MCPQRGSAASNKVPALIASGRQGCWDSERPGPKPKVSSGLIASISVVVAAAAAAAATTTTAA